MNMEIKTEYNFGDRVWILIDNTVKCLPILGIHILAEDGKPVIVRYKVSDKYVLDGTQFFKSKEELIKSL